MFHFSLARKCQLLFGFAVLLIIAAALFVPGYFMEMFVHELHLRRARQLAMLAWARLHPTAPDWRKEQDELDSWWEVNEIDKPETKMLKLPLDLKPQYLKLPPEPTKSTLEQSERIRAFWQDVRLLVARSWTWSGRHLGETDSMRLAMGALQSLPQPWGERLRQGVRLAGQRSVALIAESIYPRLDEWQRSCVERMRRDPAVNEIVYPSRQPVAPSKYRFALAVRGPTFEGVPGPLLGIVHVELPPDELIVFARATIMLAGTLAGFLAILVFYLISQRLILAPVRELTKLAEDIAAGELAARADLATGDEFEDLSDAFNDMLVRLEHARLELEAANRGLDARLGELAETNVALYESNRVKSEFLANVSHELRTPLTSIIGFADLLRDAMGSGSGIDHSRAARYADNILTSGRGLLDLINDLLDLAKIEARRVELHRASFSLTDLCDGLMDFVRPTADKKKLRLEVAYDDNPPMMNSDAGKLRQILFNLLSNAIKYTPDGGSVTLNVTGLDEGQRVRLSVTDTGPGISAGDQERIFEKFRQLDASVTRTHTGTGLGLAISKELCGLLGGTIRVESELGQGARFIVELPIECSETAERPLPTMT